MKFNSSPTRCGFSFVQPIRKDRRKIACLIDEIRTEVQATGGVTEKEIDHLIKKYRQQKRAKK